MEQNQRTKPRYIIGIDPDAEKSGIAIIDRETRKLVMTAALAFPVLIDKIRNFSCLGNILVLVEASWLASKKNWHVTAHFSANKCAAIGLSLGRNQETGHKIVEMMEHLKIPCQEKKPLEKTWSGPDRKITQKELAYFVKDLPGRTNQEERDAVLIAWDFCGWPMRVKTFMTAQKLADAEYIKKLIKK